MVGNFRKGFIFEFFTSQEPFAKIKTAKNFFCPRAKWANRFSIWPTSNYLAVPTPIEPSQRPYPWRLSLSIQEIEVLQKHRRTNRTAAEGREWKQSLLWTSWVWGYINFSSYQNKELSLPFLSVAGYNAWIPDSPTVKIKTARSSETELWPVSWKFVPTKTSNHTVILQCLFLIWLTYRIVGLFCRRKFSQMASICVFRE